MKRSKIFKVCLTLVMSLILCFNFSTVLFAADLFEKEGFSEKATSSFDVQPMAISGSGSITVNGYGEFTINSPGWSLFGHATVTVKGSNGRVVVSIIDPNGKTVVPTAGLIFNSDGTINQNITNAPSGTYTVRIQTTNGSATVTVSLHDWYS